MKSQVKFLSFWHSFVQFYTFCFLLAFICKITFIKRLHLLIHRAAIQGKTGTYFSFFYHLKWFPQIDFEKSQNKKLEKDLKKTLASLEEERANAARHKQVAIMLIKVCHFNFSISLLCTDFKSHGII